MARFLGGGGPAWALTVTYSSCAQQADKPLRFDCTVTTDALSDVFMQFGKDLTLGCESGRNTPTSLNKYTHTVTMYGMKPSTLYDWRARAVPAGGGTGVNGTCGQTSTGVLPSGTGTSELTSLNITTSARRNDGYDLEQRGPARA